MLCGRNAAMRAAKRGFMKIKARFRVITAIEGILGFVGFLLIVTIGYIGDREKTRDLMEAYTEGIANGVSTFFAGAGAIASAAATIPSVQAFDWEAASSDLAGFARFNPYILGITLADSDGYVYDTYPTGPSGNPWQGGRRTEDNTVPDSPPITVRDLPNFRLLVEENVRGEFFLVMNEPYIPEGLTEKVFVTTAPIIKDGRAVGSVSVAQTTLDVSMVYEDLSMDFLDKFGRKAHIYLVSEGGQLVSYLAYSEKHGAYMDELFGSEETVPVSALGQDTASAIAEAVAHDKRVVAAKMHGITHLFSGVKIAQTPFAVCLAVSRAYMLRTASAIFAASAAFLLLSALVFFVGRLFVRRLKSSSYGKGQDKGGKHPQKKRRAKWRRGFGEDIDAPLLPPQ